MADGVALAAAGANIGRSILPRKLGRYELLAALAKGGMGEVYLACTRGPGGFERLVVVKCALPGLFDNREQNLLAEARIAANLQHTNIVQVHDVGIEDGVVFIAMEYLHGQDLRAILDRAWGTQRPLGLDPEIAIALSMCAGLHYAHDKRDTDGSQLEIVHRDISPSNVIVTYDGSVKIIDFGIAKATSLPSETQLGLVKGKPGYMSPEQCQSEPLDRRSDVFCLGIVLYQLTTGFRPFGGGSEYEIAKSIVEREPVWPRAIDGAYPAELETIVRRALAKDRRHRFPTAQAMHGELSAFASRQRLDVSQFALQRAMTSLFQAELDAWEAAQGNEQSMVDYAIQHTAETRAFAARASVPTFPTTTSIDEGDASAAAPSPSAAPTVRGRPARRARRTTWVAVAAAIAVGIAGGVAVHYAGSAASAPQRATTPPLPAAPSPAAPSPAAPSPAVAAPLAAPDAAIVAPPADAGAAASGSAAPPVLVPVAVPGPVPAVVRGSSASHRGDRPHRPPTKRDDPDEIVR